MSQAPHVRETSSFAGRRWGWLPAACTACAIAFFVVACQTTSASKPALAPEPSARDSLAPPSKPAGREVRATGTIRAVQEVTVLTPRISGQSPRLTLTRLIPTGSVVQKGDTLAEFDYTRQVDDARDAQAKFDDLSHQVDQRGAENRSNEEKRAQEMQQAEADLQKAKLQLRKGAALPEIERLKSEARAEDAQAHVASLAKSHKARQVADDAALRILELRRDRQKVALERLQKNLEKLVVRSPLAAMVAVENTWRGGSMGPAQEGDQMYSGQPLLRIFDPSQMEVHTQVGEPDGAVLVPGARARVTLDAYPGLAFEARLHSASPVAAAAVGNPIKRFAARFRIVTGDPRLLPDLSAAVVILGKEGDRNVGGRP